MHIRGYEILIPSSLEIQRVIKESLLHIKEPVYVDSALGVRNSDHKILVYSKNYNMWMLSTSSERGKIKISYEEFIKLLNPPSPILPVISI